MAGNIYAGTPIYRSGGNVYAPQDDIFSTIFGQIPNYFPSTGGATVIGANGQPVYNPSVSVNQGGYQVNVTPLDKILAGVLSGFAILKGQPYVPTTTQPQQQPIILAGNGGIGGGVGGGGGSTNVLGKAEAWIMAHKGATAIIVLGILAAPALLKGVQGASSRR